jgi:hypothetical protein
MDALDMAELPKDNVLLYMKLFNKYLWELCEKWKTHGGTCTANTETRGLGHREWELEKGNVWITHMYLSSPIFPVPENNHIHIFRLNGRTSPKHWKTTEDSYGWQLTCGKGTLNDSEVHTNRSDHFESQTDQINIFLALLQDCLERLQAHAAEAERGRRQAMGFNLSNPWSQKKEEAYWEEVAKMNSLRSDTETFNFFDNKYNSKNATENATENTKGGGRKSKRRKRRKRICCAGPGCPEWKHCIHVLGDGDKYRPKSKAALKRLKIRVLATNKRRREHNATKKKKRRPRRKVRRKRTRRKRRRRKRTSKK